MDFYFPIIRDPPQETKKISKQVVDIVTTLRECCVEARKQNALESKRQTRLYNRGFNASTLQAGDYVLLKTDAFKGKRKLKDNWLDEVYKVIRPMGDNIPTFEIEGEDGQIRVAHRNRLLLYEPPRGTPLPLDADAQNVNHGPQPTDRDGVNRNRDNASRNRNAIGPLPGRRAQAELDDNPPDNNTANPQSAEKQVVDSAHEQYLEGAAAQCPPEPGRCCVGKVIDWRAMLRFAGPLAQYGPMIAAGV